MNYYASGFYAANFYSSGFYRLQDDEPPVIETRIQFQGLMQGLFISVS